MMWYWLVRVFHLIWTSAWFCQATPRNGVRGIYEELDLLVLHRCRASWSRGWRSWTARWPPSRRRCRSRRRCSPASFPAWSKFGRKCSNESVEFSPKKLLSLSFLSLSSDPMFCSVVKKNKIERNIITSFKRFRFSSIQSINIYFEWDWKFGWFDLLRFEMKKNLSRLIFCLSLIF